MIFPSLGGPRDGRRPGQARAATGDGLETDLLGSGHWGVRLLLYTSPTQLYAQGLPRLVWSAGCPTSSPTLSRPRCESALGTRRRGCGVPWRRSLCSRAGIAALYSEVALRLIGQRVEGYD